MTIERRDYPRVEFAAPVVVATASGHRYQARMQDLSIGGALLSAPGLDELPYGTDVVVQVSDGVDLPGRVRWTKPNAVGIQFALMGVRETHFIANEIRLAMSREASQRRDQ